MNKLELINQLKNESIPSDCYSLEGGLPNEKWCLEHNSGGWEVYYSERGIKSQKKVYKSEEDACIDLYNRIKQAMKYI